MHNSFLLCSTGPLFILFSNFWHTLTHTHMNESNKSAWKTWLHCIQNHFQRKLEQTQFIQRHSDKAINAYNKTHHEFSQIYYTAVHTRSAPRDLRESCENTSTAEEETEWQLPRQAIENQMSPAQRTRDGKGSGRERERVRENPPHSEKIRNNKWRSIRWISNKIGLIMCS